MNGTGETWHTPGVTADNPYRSLPSVDELAAQIEGRLPWPLLVASARLAIDEAREAIASGDPADVAGNAERIVRALERRAGVRVINATGVLLHTNLGRAPWSERAVERALSAASHYTNLEIDLESGERSRRGRYVTELLQALTGAEDAVVVNNNASAVLLALAATSSGKAVPVARGELIEIGGSYRLPAVMEVSGARLVEVGTTNRTRLGDYETALQVHRCGAVLKVHPSNYRIEGFTSQPDLADLADLAHSRSLPLLYDVGSGLLDAETPWLEGGTPSWIADEPAVRQTLAAGADAVTFSGDKLLGGPQAGIVAGRAETVERLRAHPLARALRVDGATYAALTATLEAYAEGTAGELPFWRIAALSYQQLLDRAAT
ncbi:MAG TPA: L-seryl-tRNA(Sec) selenium transferase, partial [Acidimicrobiia bacterium]|nr:L-seryl-tRNA(Sec) selenium transferase [Acidimicrobiia bacterium]